MPRWVVLIEGSQPEAVTAALEGPLGASALAEFETIGDARGTYLLEFDLPAPAVR